MEAMVVANAPRQADSTGADEGEKPPMTATVAVKLLRVMNEAASARRLLRSILSLRVLSRAKLRRPILTTGGWRRHPERRLERLWPRIFPESGLSRRLNLGLAPC